MLLPLPLDGGCFGDDKHGACAQNRFKTEENECNDVEALVNIEDVGLEAEEKHVGKDERKRENHKHRQRLGRLCQVPQRTQIQSPPVDHRIHNKKRKLKPKPCIPVRK